MFVPGSGAPVPDPGGPCPVPPPTPTRCEAPPRLLSEPRRHAWPGLGRGEAFIGGQTHGREQPPSPGPGPGPGGGRGGVPGSGHLRRQPPGRPPLGPGTSAAAGLGRAVVLNGGRELGRGYSTWEKKKGGKSHFWGGKKGPAPAETSQVSPGSDGAPRQARPWPPSPCACSCAA